MIEANEQTTATTVQGLISSRPVENKGGSESQQPMLPIAAVVSVRIVNIRTHLPAHRLLLRLLRGLQRWYSPNAPICGGMRCETYCDRQPIKSILLTQAMMRKDIV